MKRPEKEGREGVKIEWKKQAAVSLKMSFPDLKKWPNRNRGLSG